MTKLPKEILNKISSLKKAVLEYRAKQPLGLEMHIEQVEQLEHAFSGIVQIMAETKRIVVCNICDTELQASNQYDVRSLKNESSQKSVESPWIEGVRIRGVVGWGSEHDMEKFVGFICDSCLSKHKFI